MSEKELKYFKDILWALQDLNQQLIIDEDGELVDYIGNKVYENHKLLYEINDKLDKIVVLLEKNNESRD